MFTGKGKISIASRIDLSLNQQTYQLQASEQTLFLMANNMFRLIFLKGVGIGGGGGGGGGILKVCMSS